MSIKQLDPSQIRYTPDEGEVIQTPEGDYLIWQDGNWNKINVEGSNISMGLYDMNKQIIAQLPTLTTDDLLEKLPLVEELHNKYNNEYYMLYGKEISYFTLFKLKQVESFPHEAIDCLQNIGPIKAIDLTEDKDAIEAWVMADDEATCLYLFPYDMGVVVVGE
jgi:hypothetical protein